MKDYQIRVTELGSVVMDKYSSLMRVGEIVSDGFVISRFFKEQYETDAEFAQEVNKAVYERCKNNDNV